MPIDLGIANNATFVAHMSALQGIVSRLATSSASCKTWCLALVTALLSLAGSAHAPDLLPLALVPVAVFAFLDVNYLSQERWFRHQYAEMAKKAQQDDYSRADLFAMPRRPWAKACEDFVGALFSWSVLPVYGGLAAGYWLGHDVLITRLAAASAAASACAHS